MAYLIFQYLTNYHFHLNQTLEMDEWIYSRHKDSKGIQPGKSSLHDFQILHVVENYVLKLGPDRP
jgi:hypothetical protein